MQTYWLTHKISYTWQTTPRVITTKVGFQKCCLSVHFQSHVQKLLFKSTRRSYSTEHSLSIFHSGLSLQNHESKIVLNKIMDISPVTADLKDNLFYNPNKDSTLKHIEVTEDSVRLEFSNTDGMD